MANNWYSKDDWYSPLQSVPTVNAVTPKEKKKNKKVRIIGGICLLLVLLVATSLIFAERGGQSGFDAGMAGADDGNIKLSGRKSFHSVILFSG